MRNAQSNQLLTVLPAVEAADDGRPPVARRRQREGVRQAVADPAP